MKFTVNIPNTLGEINGNVVWKLENVATTLNEIIHKISTILPYTSKRDTSFQFFFIVDEIFR